MSQLEGDAPPRFWATVADELFANVVGLLEPIDTFISHRSEHEGFSAMLVGNLIYTVLFPHLG